MRLDRCLKLHCRDLGNILRYGASAPRTNERIYVNPAECKTYITGYRGDEWTGVVLHSYRTGKERNLSSNIKISCCLKHWRDAQSWKETGVYDHMTAMIAKNGKWDGCSNMEEVYARYRRIDGIFEQVKREGRLRLSSEINPSKPREMGGILIHLGESGRPIFGHSGCHRFAMALALNLRSIPARLGFVHVSALQSLASRQGPEGITAPLPEAT